MYYIVAFRESGPVSKCPIPFADLEAAKFCAEIALLHFGPDWTVAVEEDPKIEDVAARLIPEHAASVPRCRHTTIRSANGGADEKLQGDTEGVSKSGGLSD